MVASDPSSSLTLETMTKFLITIQTDKQTFQCSIISAKEATDVLYDFLRERYPSKPYKDILSQEGDEEKTLLDRLDHEKEFYREEDTKIECYLGKIDITEYIPEMARAIDNEITPEQFQLMCCNEWNKLTFEMPKVPENYENRHLPCPDHFKVYRYEG